MLLSLPNNGLSLLTNRKFLLLLIPAQLICLLLLYGLPFRDITSWSLPLPKIGLDPHNPTPSPLPKWSGEEDPAMVGAIVAGVLKIAEVEWMEPLTSNWTIHITDVQNTTTHFNKGHESMVYLEHILEHWDTLAPVTLFIHGHLESWHQDWPMNETVRSLNLTEVEKEGYINLRCNWEHGCPARVFTTVDLDAGHIDVTSDTGEEYLVLKGITEIFPYLFPNESLPDVLGSPCCAQFAATREAIHRRGKHVFENMKQWIMETRYNDHVSGTVVERLWAYTLRGADKDTVFCMSPQYCRCRFYNKCMAPPNPFQYHGPVGHKPTSVRFDITKPPEEEISDPAPESDIPPSSDNNEAGNGHAEAEKKEGDVEGSSDHNQENQIESAASTEHVEDEALKKATYDYRPGRPPHSPDLEIQRAKDKVVVDHKGGVEGKVAYR